MSGTLYLVATPIGNLGDITFRAVETLKNVDIVACEDTRRTLALLTYLHIKKPLFSYYKQKEREGGEKICSFLAEGKNVALVSDAGMPCISDPGAVVTKRAREEGYTVTVVPGACAAVSAVALCGIDSGFVFVGFLPEKKKDASAVLDGLKESRLPLVFYAAPHDMEKTLSFLYKELGERSVYAVKELTKLYETVYSGTLGSLSVEAKGEFVLVIMPEVKEEKVFSDGDIERALKEELKKTDKKTAVTNVSKSLKISKNRVYKISLSL